MAENARIRKDNMITSIVASVIASALFAAIVWHIDRHRRELLNECELWKIRNNLSNLMRDCDYGFYDATIVESRDIINSIVNVKVTSNRFKNDYSKFKFTILYDIYRRCEFASNVEVGLSGENEKNSRCKEIMKRFGYSQYDGIALCKLVDLLVLSNNKKELKENLSLVFTGMNKQQIREYIVESLDSNHTNNGSTNIIIKIIKKITNNTNKTIDEKWKEDIFSMEDFTEFVDKLLK